MSPLKNPSNFRHKKTLGQNFLINQNVLRRIAQACDLKKSDAVIEIGPGQGALTQHLSEAVDHVLAIELDKELCEKHLCPKYEGTNVSVINKNVLKYPFDNLPGRWKIIGNLPYNISTPIIEKIFMIKDKCISCYFTVQLEFAKRLTAAPGSKAYGSLSCFVQYFCNPKILFKINPQSFKPAPNVLSCFMELSFPDKPKYRVQNEDFLFKVIRQAFSQRRKTIQNSLSGKRPKTEVTEILSSLKIPLNARAENLALEDYIKISKMIKNSEGK